MADFDVLLIEDDKDVRLGCMQALKLENFSVAGVGSVEEARHYLPALRKHGILITDMKLPGLSGLAFQKEISELEQDLPVIIITGHGDVATAVEAMHNGAYDFLSKPFTPQQLTNVARRALDKRRLIQEVYQLRRQLADASALETRLIGNSAPMTEIREVIKDIAITSANVMVYGETGTGKELVARCIHDLSGRRGPFVALNCGGLPETLFDSEIFGHESGAFSGALKQRIGKLEYANKGTLFLDEIESMPLSMQIKLLRVLQERKLERLGSNTLIPIDIRIVSASKASLLDLAEQGQFRADLHFRLDVVNIKLPPLRERPEDIPLLFDLFVNHAMASYDRQRPTITETRVHRLMSRRWPGNVRELRNEAERFVLGIKGSGGGEDTEETCLSLSQIVDNFERSVIMVELAHHDGSLSRAAEALHIAKSTLSDKIKKHGIKL